MKGTFIVSLDFEMLWGLAGWNMQQVDNYAPHVEGSLRALKGILEILERYGVKCTVGYVGGMNYTSVEDFKQVDVKKMPSYNEPAFSSYHSLIPHIGKEFPEKLFFCKEVIDSLKENKFVELGSHTFSHYYCLEEGQTMAEFEADIQMAVTEAARSGIQLRTIIFPRNQVSSAYLKVCMRYGFTHYRGNLETYLYRSEQTPARFSLRRVLRLADAYFNLSGYNSYDKPVETDGIINVPSSRFYRPYSSLLAFLEPLKVRRVKRSIEYAAKHGKIYHLWWHPHNFGLHTEKNLAQLEDICRQFKTMHEKWNMESKFISEMCIDKRK